MAVEWGVINSDVCISLRSIDIRKYNPTKPSNILSAQTEATIRARKSKRSITSEKSVYHLKSLELQKLA
jgi:hypothetical protein